MKKERRAGSPKKEGRRAWDCGWDPQNIQVIAVL